MMSGQGISARITLQRGRRRFLAQAATGLLAGAASLALQPGARALARRGKVNRQKLLEYPTVSLKEKDRRWKSAWQFMREQKVDALLMPARPDPETHGNYFTNDPTPMAVFFPAPERGDPIAFLPGMSQPNVDWLLGSLRDGPDPWFKDVRVAGALGPDLVETIKARNMAGARIGTIDVFITEIGVNGIREAQSAWNTDPLGAYLKANLPQATFVELFNEFLPVWATHSQEEIMMARKAALALEAAAEAVAEASRPGNSLSDLEMAIIEATVPYGIDATAVGGILYTGPEGGRGTRRRGNGLPPLVIKAGDLVHTEMVRHFGHMRGDVQLTISVGEPNPEIATLARIAREAYDAGLQQIRPGNTFGAVCDTMSQTIRRARAWHITPVVHLMNPNEARSMMRDGIWENYTGIQERLGTKVTGSPVLRPDLVLREGMLFAFEPNAMFGRKYVNIGGGVLCTKTGCEELNDILTRMVVVDV